MIVLPEDASESETSGGYRYVGPTYTKHDLYAKALIDEAYWKRINSLDRGKDIYQSSEDSMEVIDDSLDLSESTVDISELQPRFDFDTVDNNNSNDNSSSGTILRSFGIAKVGLLVLFLMNFVSCTF